MTIDQAADLFLLFISGRGRSQTTVCFYRRYLAEWRRGIGIDNLADVTPELLDEWAAGLREVRQMFPNHHRPNTAPQSRPYSPHTVAGMIGAVKSFVSFCVARGYIQCDVAAHLRKPGLSHQARNKAMRVQDLYRMLDVAGVRDRAMLLFMADTGARRGEVVGLRVGALDLDGLCGEARHESKTNTEGAQTTKSRGAGITRYVRFCISIDRGVCDGPVGIYSGNK